MDTIQAMSSTLYLKIHFGDKKNWKNRGRDHNNPDLFLAPNDSTKFCQNSVIITTLGEVIDRVNDVIICHVL